MLSDSYKYIIVGAGLTGASAVEGIREVDKNGSILLVGSESHLPYNRPPLSKKLWLKKQKIEDIFVYDQAFYQKNNVTLLLKTTVTSIDPSNKKISCDNTQIIKYEKLLLATGGNPRHLTIPGGNLEGISYYRTLDDYTFIREKAEDNSSVLIIGGGFIGSEMAAALNGNNIDVTMIFPDKLLVQRVFPENLARAVQEKFKNHGIKILSEDQPIAIESTKNGFSTQTKSGKKIESNMIIVGVGLDPSIELASTAGLKVGNGIIVNQYLETSQTDIFAAGDNANFPYIVLGQQMRVEHWDNSINQGKLAGKNMAGLHLIYDYMPYFFSDLFDLGYEAVGEVDSRLEVFTDWQKENEKGIIYYLKDGRVRGAMMCNVWDKVQWARDLIKKGEKIAMKKPTKPEETLIPKEEINDRLKTVPSWTLHDGAIVREFSFKDFHQAMDFVDDIAELAEMEDHHPDIHISYNKVRLDLSTHKAGGLTPKDFRLATDIDHLIY